jgi:hypothetical protein
MQIIFSSPFSQGPLFYKVQSGPRVDAWLPFYYLLNRQIFIKLGINILPLEAILPMHFWISNHQNTN